MAVCSRSYCVYILTNDRRTVLYTGVTNDLERRLAEHRSGEIPGFTRQYHLLRLVYYEVHQDPEAAIQREKQLKRRSRAFKVKFIESFNPEWRDLGGEIADT